MMEFPRNFVCAGTDFCTPEKHVPAPLFRHTFTVNGAIEKAVIRITGLGYYELHINGTDITKGFMAPYRSNPDDYVYYDDYDLSPWISQGKNVIAVILGNGFQNALGGYVWSMEQAAWRSAPLFTFHIEIRYKDGTVQTVCAGKETKTAPSAILFDDLHFGEYYDARLERPGWDTTDFDDRDWKPALPAAAPRGTPRICEAEPIVIRETFAPVAVTEYRGGYIYEFPENAAGVCQLKIEDSEPGQKILMQHFEMMLDGKPHFANIRFDEQRDLYQEDIYYCAGRPCETHVPRFTYHGFRYVYVTGIRPEQAKKELLTFLVICSDVKQIGNFTCDDEVANALQRITLRSDVSNLHYFPTDCPQREKNGWTGDASLSAEQMLLNYSVEKSFREWMRNIYKALNEKGQLPGIIPTAGWGYHWGNGPGWDGVLVNIPYYAYRYRGDRTFLEEAAVPLMRYLTYLYTQLTKDDLIEIGLGDYLQPALPADDYETPTVVTSSILSADIAEKAAFFYDVLEMPEQKQYAQALRDRLVCGVRKHLIDHQDYSVKGNTQTGQAMAIYYGMFTDSEKPKAIQRLLAQIHACGGHFNTGILGTRVIFCVLADNGYADLAYDMIVRPEFPSFGNWICRGATALREQFWPDDHGCVGSLNHHFWGHISAWLYTYPGGIRVNPTGRNVSNIDVAPMFLQKLNRVQASHTLPSGTVTVCWQRESDAVKLKIEIPAGTEGKIRLPDGYRFENGTCEQPLASGEYRVCKIR